MVDTVQACVNMLQVKNKEIRTPFSMLFWFLMVTFEQKLHSFTGSIQNISSQILKKSTDQVREIQSGSLKW